MKVLGYNLMQAMRFAVEEINNCSSLLPGVRLGYEMVDVCYLSNNIQPGLYFLAQDDDFLPILEDYSEYRPHVVAVIGPDNSESAITVSNILSYFLIPQVMTGRVRGGSCHQGGMLFLPVRHGGNMSGADSSSSLGLTYWEACDKSLHPSEPQFPHL